jgi:hypothetical protein
MLCVTSWLCDCGTHVKVMYDTNGMTRILCPDPNGKCTITHPVGGKVSHLWREGTDQLWQSLPVAPFVVAY